MTGAIRQLPRTVIALGLVSLLTDLSSEMIIPLLPAFLTTQLGASGKFFGLIEGMAESIAAMLKLFSGAWSDRMGRRRPLVIFGYSLSAAMRPLMALCSAPWQALVVRSADRVGKGLRSAPRDTLLSAAAPPESRGFAFGFHRAMDHLGAMLGALAAMLLLHLGLGVRQVFLFAAIPGVFAVLAILYGVGEKPGPASKAKEPVRLLHWSSQPAALRRYLVVLALFTLANSSDTFLLLKAGEAGVPLQLMPLLWIVLHLTKTVANLAGGHLSDRIGARTVIRWGWLVYGAVYALFGFATASWEIWLLFGLYGLYHGLTECAEKSLVASLSGPNEKGSAFGWYHAISGMVALPASLLTGVLWDWLGSSVALAACGATAVLAAFLFKVAVPKH